MKRSLRNSPHLHYGTAVWVAHCAQLGQTEGVTTLPRLGGGPADVDPSEEQGHVVVLGPGLCVLVQLGLPLAEGLEHV